jgi:hypothetical protein
MSDQDHHFSVPNNIKRWEAEDRRKARTSPAPDKGERIATRLVSEQGVATASELMRDQDNWSRKRQEQGATEATVDALMFSLRSRGIAALSE